jgi:sugar phosphate permease
MASQEEKPTVKQDSLQESIEDVNALESGMSRQDLGRALTRIDWRLLPALGLVYGISLMDRKNTANAAIAGMLVDLNIVTGNGYNIITLSFFLSNVLAQPVMAVLCRKVGPRPFLSGVCVAWGVVIIGLGFVKHWVAQVPLRLLLGVFEAGFGPGSIYLLSTWYTRCMCFLSSRIVVQADA